MKIDELKDYLNQKSSKVKTALKTGIATALTAGVLLTGVACDDQNLEVDTKEPSITDSQGNTVVTDEQGNPITTETTKKENQIIEPGEFYGEDDAEFTPVELPRDIEDCTSTEKMETFLKNYLRDETASIRFFAMYETIGSNNQLVAKIDFACNSTKGENAEGNFVKASFVIEDQKSINKLFEYGNRYSADASNINELETCCDKVYDIVSKQFEGQNFRDYVRPVVQGRYTSQLIEAFREALKNTFPDFETNALCVKLFNEEDRTEFDAGTITPYDSNYLFVTSDKNIYHTSKDAGLLFMDLETTRAIEELINKNNIKLDEDNMTTIYRIDDPELFEQFCELFCTKILNLTPEMVK